MQNINREFIDSTLRHSRRTDPITTHVSSRAVKTLKRIPQSNSSALENALQRVSCACFKRPCVCVCASSSSSSRISKEKWGTRAERADAKIFLVYSCASVRIYIYTSSAGMLEPVVKAIGAGILFRCRVECVCMCMGMGYMCRSIVREDSYRCDFLRFFRDAGIW